MPDTQDRKAAPSKVLIVEDEGALREFFTYDFETAGFQVATARDGEEASQILSSESFDVVISDLRLPKKNGLALLGEVRTLRQHERPIFVGITGAEMISLEKAYDLGMHELVEKPFDRQLLLEKVIRHLLPPADRWQIDASVAAESLGGRLEIDFETPQLAQEKGVFSLGLNGFFVALSDHPPKPGDRLEFLVKFERPSVALEGYGEVRWVRASGAEGPPGVGVEIQGLTAGSSEDFTALLDVLRPTAVIPRV